MIPLRMTNTKIVNLTISDGRTMRLVLNDFDEIVGLWVGGTVWVDSVVDSSVIKKIGLVDLVTANDSISVAAEKKVSLSEIVEVTGSFTLSISKSIGLSDAVDVLPESKMSAVKKIDIPTAVNVIPCDLQMVLQMYFSMGEDALVSDSTEISANKQTSVTANVVVRNAAYVRATKRIDNNTTVVTDSSLAIALNCSLYMSGSIEVYGSVEVSSAKFLGYIDNHFVVFTSDAETVAIKSLKLVHTITVDSDVGVVANKKIVVSDSAYINTLMNACLGIPIQVSSNTVEANTSLGMLVAKIIQPDGRVVEVVDEAALVALKAFTATLESITSSNAQIQVTKRISAKETVSIKDNVNVSEIDFINTTEHISVDSSLGMLIAKLLSVDGIVIKAQGEASISAIKYFSPSVKSNVIADTKINAKKGVGMSELVTSKVAIGMTQIDYVDIPAIVAAYSDMYTIAEKRVAIPDSVDIEPEIMFGQKRIARLMDIGAIGGYAGKTMSEVAVYEW